MDSFEWNKIAGAVLGTLLFVVAVRIATGFIFEVKEPAKPGYVVQGVEVPTGTGATQAAAAEEQMPDWGTVLAKANTANGKSVSGRCEQCHDLSKGGPNKIGPNLWAIVDSPRGEDRGGFDFSAAMKAKGGKWTYDELFKFLKSPGAYIPGTKMTFAGLRSPTDRIDLIGYLRTQADTPAPIPPPQPAKAAAAAAPKTGGAPAAAPNAGAPKTTAGPNGTAAVAPGNQPANATSTAGTGNAASGSAGNAGGPSGGDSGKDSSTNGSVAHVGNAPAPATGKAPSAAAKPPATQPPAPQPPKKP